MIAGSDAWWEVVRGSTFFEAESLLRHYRGELLRECEGVADFATGAVISRVNDEIHRLAQLQNRVKLTQAIRNVFGQEGQDAVLEELARLEQMARMEALA